MIATLALVNFFAISLIGFLIAILQIPEDRTEMYLKQIADNTLGMFNYIHSSYPRLINMDKRSSEICGCVQREVLLTNDMQITQREMLTQQTEILKELKKMNELLIAKIDMEVERDREYENRAEVTDD